MGDMGGQAQRDEEEAEGVDDLSADDEPENHDASEREAQKNTTNGNITKQHWKVRWTPALETVIY